MLSTKRKAGVLPLGRRVRARRDEDDSDVEPVVESGSEGEGDGIEDDNEDDNEDEDEDEDEDDDDEGSDEFEGLSEEEELSDEELSDDEDEKPGFDFSTISFGELSEAQRALRTQSSSSSTTTTEEPLASKRPIKKTDIFTKATVARSVPSSAETVSRKQPLTMQESLAQRREAYRKAQAAAGKGAPEEITSKKRVGRWREVVPDTTPKARDPRFDPVSSTTTTTAAARRGGQGRQGAGSGVSSREEAAFQRNYAFLQDYRESEIRDLKQRIRDATRKRPADDDDDPSAAPAASPEELHALRQELKSLESKRRASERKQQEQRILDQHKADEKERVRRTGKQPYFLKKAELKQRVLRDRFASLSAREVDRAVQRKRKKVAGRDKKELARLERVDGSTRNGR